jgi:hypothetical protein
MPQGITTKIQFIEPWPAPGCNLSDQAIEQFGEELDRYVKLFQPTFRRRVYVQGYRALPSARRSSG